MALTYTKKKARILARVRAIRDRHRKALLGAEKVGDEWQTQRVDLARLSWKERAQVLQEERDRKRFIPRKMKEFHKAQRRGLPPSSFVNELIYHEVENKVQVKLQNRWYTYFNIPKITFNNWEEGLATCQTDDYRKQKRWIRGKTPSLGAFFNQHIKEVYRWTRGRV